jgi:hypothetical protein
VEVLGVFGNSDHDIIVCKIICDVIIVKSKQQTSPFLEGN